MKTIEISYPPANSQDNWVYGGLNSRTPSMFLNPLEAAAMSNIWLRNQEIRSSHPFNLVFPGPAGSNPSLGQISFLDANGVQHTCAFTSSGLYQLSPFNSVTNANPWLFVGGSVLFTGVPVAARDFANILYYTNGVPYVQSWDGISTAPIIVSGLGSATFGGTATGVSTTATVSISSGELVSVTVLSTAGFSANQYVLVDTVGSGVQEYCQIQSITSSTVMVLLSVVNDHTEPFPVAATGGSMVGGKFLYEINNQICLLSVSFYNSGAITNPIPGTGPTSLAAGSTTEFPQLLWYSANGVPDEFDPNVNTSAGFNNFLDVPDTFTGAMAFGEVAYLFRRNGITYQTIGGNNALQPFYFDHLWSSEAGIGNVYPWSIAQYGGSGFFVATDNVYLATVSGFTPIGAGARDAIMSDLSNATATPVGSVIPGFSSGYVYLRYDLAIPLGTSTRIYSYSLEDKNWIRQDLANMIVSGRPTLCWR